eukprot:CAMPEP_0198257088 /NCGR_PEP_ID=MMETSP1447-20131203/6842_1 /TAXON_ID=420782 /ORGANISM="Chaetoceros dichaeta, Strain CCMP1751" /LENGTH=673 /DNA_ID=CAMNT_0043943895 /DNA_START=86 /DNA_END=2107 /DNA_ORIENTATION=+
MTASIEIIPTSCLDWPSSPTLLPKTTIRIGSPSYLSYTSRSTPTNRTPLSQFHTDGEDDDSSSTTSSQKSSIVNQIMKDKKQTTNAAIDLTTLTPAELGELTYYEILGGIKMHSTPEQVKRAFHKASLKYHPDKQEEQQQQKIAETNNGEGGGADSENDTNDDKKKPKEDPIFLKVKEAFETLGGDPSKRKAYDSTINFDESIPSAADVGGTESDFYKIFGKCFERNLRFAVENDPALFGLGGKNGGAGAGGGGGRGGGRGKGGKGKGGGKNHKQSNKSLPTLGDTKSTITQVNEFYEYWIHFDSWRDFTIPAAKLTENDTENYEMCRFQKRAMEQEIARKAKSLKKEEMARISKLVERSMALDPRLKKEKERLEEEKADKIRQKKERQEQIEKDKLDKENREAKELADQEQKEKEERAKMKAKREQEKKILRKSRQSLRRMSIAEDMKYDVEFLCERLNATQIDELTMRMSIGGETKHEHLIKDSVDDLKEDDNKKVIEENKKREIRRREAVEKEAAAKAARASKPWSKEELAALTKAVKKYPAGGANRWETISLFINNLCRLEDPRSKEQCIEKYNQVQNSSTSQESTAAPLKSPSNKQHKKEKTAPVAAVVNPWTDDQVKQLQKGLSKFPASMDKNERWAQISQGVTGKTKKECVQRFKVIRANLLKRSK